MKLLRKTPYRSRPTVAAVRDNQPAYCHWNPETNEYDYVVEFLDPTDGVRFRVVATELEWDDLHEQLQAARKLATA